MIDGHERKGYTMIIIAGLGNPTAGYEKTRHNVGFDVIDAAAEKYGIAMNRRQSKAVCGSGFIGGQKVLLVKPQTYMNLSGDSIAPLLRFYRLDPEQDLIVVYDDINLDPGRLRVRKRGSAGGHNGIKDLIAKTGSDGFSRIRVGVGNPPPERDLADYVLSRFSGEDRALVDAAIADAADCLALMVNGQIDEAMNQYNGQRAKRPED